MVRYWPPSGRSDVVEFIAKQPLEVKDRILWGVGLLRQYGLQKAKPIGRKLYELKVEIKRVAYRILFTIKNSIAWLLVIFKKKEQKLRKRYIDLALTRARSLN